MFVKESIECIISKLDIKDFSSNDKLRKSFKCYNCKRNVFSINIKTNDILMFNEITSLSIKCHACKLLIMYK